MQISRLIYRALLTAAVLTLTACQQTQVGPIATEGDAVHRVKLVTINGVHLLERTDGSTTTGRSLTPTAQTAVTIGVGGGVIATGAGELTVPPGALVQDVDLSMQERPTGTSFRFGPNGLAFELPATLRIAVLQQDVEGLDLSRLRIAGASDSGDDWQVIGGTYDPATGTISAPIHHFSQYALCME
ncbi:MAG: hypothetical protein ABR559_05840 [Gemmatimonadota bacterium]